MKIILGSKSQGRRKILEEMGYEFEAIAAGIDEKALRFEDPKDLTLALARAKAEALLPKIAEPAILITSDQVVVWNGLIREKPQTPKEAREFLEGYNSYPAETVTAVIATNTLTGKRAEGIDVAKVYFKNLSSEFMQEIIAKGDVLNQAGGFTIEGNGWENHIEKIEGTRDSVIGLPKDLTEKLIKAAS